MPIGRWSTAQQQAYRQTFTIGRIVDEIWILVAMMFFIVTFPFVREDSLIFGGFLLLGALSYWLLPKVLPRSMPEELRRTLPVGRFDGPTSPSAPRSYRELFRRWFVRTAGY